MGNPTVAAALATCERSGGTGKDLITSVATGFETGARIAISLGAPTLPKGNEKSGNKLTISGYSGAGRLSAPHFAAAASAARALGCDWFQITHAFGNVGAEAITRRLAGEIWKSCLSRNMPIWGTVPKPVFRRLCSPTRARLPTMASWMEREASGSCSGIRNAISV